MKNLRFVIPICPASIPTLVLAVLLSYTATNAALDSNCVVKIVGGSDLNLRAEPKKTSLSIATLNLNTRVCLESSIDKWSMISTELDRDFKGWVQSKYLIDETIDEKTASAAALKAYNTKDYSTALTWAERAVEANENPTTLAFLLKVYTQVGNEKKMKLIEDRLTTAQMANSIETEDTTKAPTLTTVSINENSSLWKTLNCDAQQIRRKKSFEPWTSIHTEKSQDIQPGSEILFSANSPLAGQIKALFKIYDFIRGEDIDECWIAPDPTEANCDNFESTYSQLKKLASDKLKHRALESFKNNFLKIDKIKNESPKTLASWWKKTKSEIFKQFDPTLDALLLEAKGGRMPNYNLTAAPEWDRFWLQQNYFAAKASESLTYTENLKFAACNYFDYTYTNRQLTDHLLGPESLLRLTQELAAKAQPESANDLLQILINEYPKAGWVEGDGHHGGSYASQSEKLLLQNSCNQQKKKSQQFQTLGELAKALQTTLKNTDPKKWTDLFSCHVLLLETKKNMFVEQISHAKSVSVLAEYKSEIINETPTSNEKSRTLSFPHVQFSLDPLGRLVFISR